MLYGALEATGWHSVDGYVVGIAPVFLRFGIECDRSLVGFVEIGHRIIDSFVHAVRIRLVVNVTY